MTFYLDTSAAVKLLIPEVESTALRRFMEEPASNQGPPLFASSEILRTELLCAAGRAGGSLTAGRRLLNSLHLIRVSTGITDYAGRLCDQVGLRSLDSLHLATALSLVDSLTAVVTYDSRMADAATRLGIMVASPGVPAKP